MDDRFKGYKTADDVADLKGLAFEEYLKQLFQDLEYDVEKTPSSGDFGGDLVIRKNGKSIVVQAKQYSSSVGFDAVKEAYFALSYYGADEAWVISTSSYTRQARLAANKVGVKLIDGPRLTKLITESSSKSNRSRNRLKQGARGARGLANDSFSIIVTEIGTVARQYHGSASEVTVPEGVSRIGELCFSVPANQSYGEKIGLEPPYCSNGAIYRVALPETMEVIGPQAFRGCKNLCSIDGGAVNEICDSAFSDCGFISVDILPNVKYGKSVYAFSKRLCSVNIIDGVDSIPSGIFAVCPSLSQVVIPQSVTHIGARAFWKCESLTAVDIPEGVQEIGPACFAGCTNLKTISLPSSLKKMAVNAFDGCGLTKKLDLSKLFDLSGVSLFTEKGQTVRPNRVSDYYKQMAFFRDGMYSCPSGCSYRVGINHDSQEAAERAFQSCLAMRREAIDGIERLKACLELIWETSNSFEAISEKLLASYSEEETIRREALDEPKRELDATPFYKRRLLNELRSNIDALEAKCSEARTVYEDELANQKKEIGASLVRLRDEAEETEGKINRLFGQVKETESAWSIPREWIEKGTVFESGSDPEVDKQQIEWFKHVYHSGR